MMSTKAIYLHGAKRIATPTLVSLHIALLTFLSIGFLARTAMSQQQGSGKSAFEQFESWDKNRDSKLSIFELPDRIQRNFPRVDRDQDQSISLDEHLSFVRGAHDGNLPDGTKIQIDIPYIQSGHERQKLDLYLPENQANLQSPRPLLIWIHGGAWRTGNKNRIPALNKLLDQGFAVASINYRLSNHDTFPAQIQDCKTAVQFLRKNAETHNIDPERFGAWGASAGGHLAALLGTSGDVGELEGGFDQPGDERTSSRVQAVCDWFGPTELLEMNRQAGPKGVIDHNASESPESKLIGQPIQEDPAKTKAADPISYVSDDDPPFLIMHGEQDKLVPMQQSVRLHELLRDQQVESELILLPEEGHGFRNPRNEDTVIKFFKSKLSDKK